MTEPGPFSLTPQSWPFAIAPGLVLMFVLAPAAAPAVALPVSSLLFGFVGAIIGLVTYKFVANYGPLARIGALTLLCLILWGVAGLIVSAA